MTTMMKNTTMRITTRMRRIDELYDDEEYYKDDYKEDEKVGVMKQLYEFNYRRQYKKVLL